MVDVLTRSGVDDELEFNLDMWTLHGQCRRRDLVEALNNTIGADRISQEITQMIQRIQGSAHYQILGEQERRSIDSKLRDNGRGYMNWRSNTSVHALALQVGYSSYHADTLYKFGSQHVHSFAYGIQQMLAETNPADQYSLCAMGATYTQMMLSLTIGTFHNVFPDAATDFPLPPDLDQLITFNHELHQTDLNQL